MTVRAWRDISHAYRDFRALDGTQQIGEDFAIFRRVVRRGFFRLRSHTESRILLAPQRPNPGDARLRHGRFAVMIRRVFVPSAPGTHDRLPISIEKGPFLSCRGGAARRGWGQGRLRPRADNALRSRGATAVFLLPHCLTDSDFWLRTF